MPEILECLARRKIHLIESESGYLAIQKVDSVGVDPLAVVGESNTSREIVKKCGRCVGLNRKCDLSIRTKQNLDLQV